MSKNFETLKARYKSGACTVEQLLRYVALTNINYKITQAEYDEIVGTSDETI